MGRGGVVRRMGAGAVRERSRGVRLTRRGRVVLIVAVAALLLIGFWLTAGRGARAGAGAGGHGGRAHGAALETVVVGSDDTLWEIASERRPKVDPRITVRRIIELNGLSGSIVQPGQRLRLPPR